MSDGQHLLRAVVAHPDEDTPRLAYADWLDEHGDPDRAEFIRVQCRLAATHDDPEWDALHAREAELRQRHGGEWAPFGSGRGVYGVTFRRGFAEVVSATAHAFAARGGLWGEQTPLRAAHLRRVAGRCGQLAATPHLDTLTEVVVRDGAFGDDDLAAFAAGPHLGGLRALAILGHPDGGTWVGDRGVSALAAAPVLPRLTRLSVEGAYRLGSLGSAGMAALAGRLGSGLRELHLTRTAVDDRGAAALAAADGPALETVSIHGSRIGTDGLVALATSARLPALSDLQLHQGRVTGAALTALARWPARARWRHIDLRGNPLGAVDVKAVADLLTAHPDLELDLSACGIPQPVQENLLRRCRGRVRLDIRSSRPPAEAGGN